MSRVLETGHLAVLLSRTAAGEAISAGACSEAATIFMRRASAYQRIQETACNCALTPQEMTRAARLEQQLRALSATWGLTASFSGDPRGYVVKLHGIGDNTWGRDGWGIG